MKRKSDFHIPPKKHRLLLGPTEKIRWRPQCPDMIRREGRSIEEEYNTAVYWLERTMLTLQETRRELAKTCRPTYSSTCPSFICETKQTQSSLLPLGEMLELIMTTLKI